MYNEQKILSEIITNLKEGDCGFSGMTVMRFDKKNCVCADISMQDGDGKVFMCRISISQVEVDD